LLESLDKKEASPATIQLFPKACEPEEEEKVSPLRQVDDHSRDQIRRASSKEITEEDNDDEGLEFEDSSPIK
jgi:hypothetical protein